MSKESVEHFSINTENSRARNLSDMDILALLADRQGKHRAVEAFEKAIRMLKIVAKGRPELLPGITASVALLKLIMETLEPTGMVSHLTAEVIAKRILTPLSAEEMKPPIPPGMTEEEASHERAPRGPDPITEERNAKIIARWNSSELCNEEIAAEFGVSLTLIEGLFRKSRGKMTRPPLTMVKRDLLKKIADEHAAKAARKAAKPPPVVWQGKPIGESAVHTIRSYIFEHYGPDEFFLSRDLIAQFSANRKEKDAVGNAFTLMKAKGHIFANKSTDPYRWYFTEEGKQARMSYLEAKGAKNGTQGQQQARIEEAGITDNSGSVAGGNQSGAQQAETEQPTTATETSGASEAEGGSRPAASQLQQEGGGSLHHLQAEDHLP